MDDKLKDQVMPAVVVFNFSLAAYVVARVVFPMLTSNRPLASGKFFTHLLIGSGIGLVAAAITLAITLRRK